VREIFKFTLEMGGTISGEHGIGLTKSAYMGMEIPEAELELMKKIKGVFDPKGILNPGKIFPE
jgi:glycolate oxidase